MQATRLPKDPSPRISTLRRELHVGQLPINSERSGFKLTRTVPAMNFPDSKVFIGASTLCWLTEVLRHIGRLPVFERFTLHARCQSRIQNSEPEEFRSNRGSSFYTK